MIFLALLVALLVPVLFAALMVAVRNGVRSREAPSLRRLGPALGGFCVAGVALAVMSGSSFGFMPVVGIVAIVSLAGVVLYVRPKPVVAERSWSAPAGALAGSGQVIRPVRPSARSVASALGRVETRQLAWSPWFGIGIGFCVLIFVLFGFVFPADDVQTWEELVQLAPWFAYPLVGMVVVASHRAVTRAVRDGADELFDSCPTAPVTRTVGFLLAAAAPVLGLTLFLVALGAALAVNSPGLHGPVGLDSVADVLAAVVLGAGGVALGVALGRWVRFGLAPVVAVVAVGFAGITLNGVGGHGWNPLMPLSTAPAVDGVSPVFTDRPTLWHLLWVAGLTALVAIGAIARHRRGRTITLAALAAVSVVAVAGIGATRPMAPASAAAIADAIANPEAHQDCTALEGPLQVCAFGIHRELISGVIERVGPVGAALPAGLEPLTLRQTYDSDLDELPPEVRRLLTEADLVRPTGEVAFGFGDRDSGFDVAFAALGIPTEPGEASLPTVLAGQARGVVAIWLATRGLDADAAAEASTAAQPGHPDVFYRGSLETDEVCSVPAVVWSAQDLAAARAVLALPEGDVRAVVADGWARWSDPSTGTDDLLAALRLPGVAPFDDVVARPGQPC